MDSDEKRSNLTSDVDKLTHYLRNAHQTTAHTTDITQIADNDVTSEHHYTILQNLQSGSALERLVKRVSTAEYLSTKLSVSSSDVSVSSATVHSPSLHHLDEEQRTRTNSTSSNKTVASHSSNDAASISHTNHSSHSRKFGDFSNLTHERVSTLSSGTSFIDFSDSDWSQDDFSLNGASHDFHSPELNLNLSSQLIQPLSASTQQSRLQIVELVKVASNDSCYPIRENHAQSSFVMETSPFERTTCTSNASMTALTGTSTFLDPLESSVLLQTDSALQALPNEDEPTVICQRTSSLETTVTPATQELSTTATLTIPMQPRPSSFSRYSFLAVTRRDSQLSNFSFLAPTDIHLIPTVNLPGFISAVEASDGFRSTANQAIMLMGSERSMSVPSPHQSTPRLTNSRNSMQMSMRSRTDLLAAGGLGAAGAPPFVQELRRPTTNSSSLMRTKSIKRHQVEHSRGYLGRWSVWGFFTHLVTCWMPPFVLSCLFGMRNPNVRQAWREKMTLVLLILFLCVVLAFFTFMFQVVACGWELKASTRIPLDDFNSGAVAIRGSLYDVSSFQHPGAAFQIYQIGGRDVSWLFPLSVTGASHSACRNIPNILSANITCDVNGVNVVGFCHTANNFNYLIENLKQLGEQSYTWQDVSSSGSDSNLMVFNGIVLNLDRYFSQGNAFLSNGVSFDAFDGLLRSYVGLDASNAFIRTPELHQKMNCLVETFKVGYLESEPIGCFASQIFTYGALTLVVALIASRFALAVIFMQFMSLRLYDPKRLAHSKSRSSTPFYEHSNKNHVDLPAAVAAALQARRDSSSRRVKNSRFSFQYNSHTPPAQTPSLTPPLVNSRSPPLLHSRSSTTNTTQYETSLSSHRKITASPSLSTASMAESSTITNVALNLDGENSAALLLRAIVLVTCYSESEVELRTTLDSLARSDFPLSHMMLFVIADGIVTGAGNLRSTPDLLIDMMELDPAFVSPPPPFAYVAIADGEKKLNMAQVYAGTYRVEERRVPMVLVVKCGTEQEKLSRKPGNRGKRDSQLILMHFLTKVIFDDRMSPLEYDLFTKITVISSASASNLSNPPTKVTPDMYEMLMMVDADTKVEQNSLSIFSATMANDPRVMGLCGETRIANKYDSWVTTIQVFEYHISHHLVKAFESFFGCVTCLPGCFCAYRIKAPKVSLEDESQIWVPLLANPDVVERYSENVVETLHDKNLLLLGEDRYLTTLMLQTFPKRTLLFVPQAVCKTNVPNRFKVLLSQRRRWINSTFHNLMELVFVRNMCGIFCFSMQFVIMLELVGSAALPCTVIFPIYLLAQSFFARSVPLVPLIVLAAILGFPALLVLFTTRRWHYVGWMFIYIAALPIWNFLFPLYAFWHFDDFTWGQTRKVAGDASGAGENAHADPKGLFDSSKITMKRWCEYEAESRKLTRFLSQSYNRSSI